jgi:hypothetical protein
MLWRALLGALDQEGLLKWDEASLDGSFAPGENCGSAVGKSFNDHNDHLGDRLTFLPLLFARYEAASARARSALNSGDWNPLKPLTPKLAVTVALAFPNRNSCSSRCFRMRSMATSARSRSTCVRINRNPSPPSRPQRSTGVCSTLAVAIGIRGCASAAAGPCHGRRPWTTDGLRRIHSQVRPVSLTALWFRSLRRRLWVDPARVLRPAQRSRESSCARDRGQ